jgi:hypothetical protein
MRPSLLLLAAFCLIAARDAAAQVKTSEGPVGRIAGAAVTLEQLSAPGSVS